MAEFDRAALRKIFEGAEIEVPKDVLGQICELHTSSMDNLPETIKELKSKLKTAEQERDAAKAKVPVDGEETVSKAEYDKLKGEFDKYKGDIEAKETKANKEKAVRAFYESKGITGKNLEIAMRGSRAEIDGIELDGDKIKDDSTLDALVKGDFSGLVATTTTKGANTANPPANNGGKTGKTKEEIMAIRDPAVRQAEIAKNPEVFGLKFD